LPSMREGDACSETSCELDKTARRQVYFVKKFGNIALFAGEITS